MTKELSTEEADVARKIQEEVERRLTYKYAILGLLISFVVGGGGIWIVREATKELIDQSKIYMGVAAQEVEHLKRRASTVDTDIDAKFKQLDNMQIQTEEAIKNADLAGSRVRGLFNQVDALQKGVATSLDSLSTIGKNNPKILGSDIQKVTDVTQTVKQANDRARNLQYIVYPHYHPASRRYVEKVRDILSSRGYSVGGATGDSRIDPQKTDVNIGPHVSYFTDPKNPDGSKTAQEVAQDIADTLSNEHLSGYGKFTVKPHPEYPEQLNLFGVWF